jgi:hypothetical protein
MPGSPGHRTSEGTIDFPPSTAMSEPVPAPSPSSRPATRQRPRTAKPRRPPSARPDTSASSIGDLPEQEFFPEGSDLEEEGDGDGPKYEDEESDDGDNPFVFNRPQTAAVPVVAFSDTNTSAPNTSMSPATAGISSPPAGLRKRLSIDAEYEPTGAVDVGGYINEPEYNPRNPPAMSGRNNPNNSIFSFSMTSKAGSVAPSTAGPSTSPNQGQSDGSRIRVPNFSRRELNTATTGMTGSTHLTVTSAGRTGSSWQSEISDGASMSDTASHDPSARRVRSTARLISSDGDHTGGNQSRRPISRGSIGLTEISGDMTVADGKTTFGDGLGGIAPIPKDGSEEGSLGDVQWDPMEEDSPYPEVRASVSNLDDPEMPGKSFVAYRTKSWGQADHVAFTIRSAFLGIVFVIICSSFNTFFLFRFPSPTINALIVE